MPDDDKKLQYLKRGDVRTMEKDMARLREQESETTREKITHLKTEEETKEAADLSAEVPLSETKAEEEKERLKTQIKEAQSREEEERRRFLEEVATKSGEKPPEFQEILTPPPIPERPAPPPTPAPLEIPPTPPLPADVPAEAPEAKVDKEPFKFSLPKVQIPKIQLPKVQIPKVSLPKVPMPKISLPTVSMPKVEGCFPAKPSIFEKIWIRIIISLFVLAILATIITFWYWYLVVREKPTPAAPVIPPPTLELEPKEITKPQVVDRILTIGYHLPKEPRSIDTIIIHSVYNDLEGDPHSIEGVIEEYKLYRVAAHYLITREGKIYQTAPDKAIAYHSGIGQMPDGRNNVNDFSIGIELINTKEESPAEAQYQSLTQLVKYLQKEYDIPAENILGHKDIAPGRKTDPWNFDWEKLKLIISSFLSPSPSTSFGAEFILKSLTLEEKIGQLFIVGFEGLELTPKLEDLMKTVHPGGIILFRKNIETPSQVKKLIQDLQGISLAETGLPLFVAVDQEGGMVSRISFIKEKTGQSVIENTDQAYKIGLERGEELKELGINLNLAPVLDLTQLGDFLHERSFQKNWEETGDLAKALILGQKTAGILTAVKHFPGYGGISFNPEEKLAALASIPQTFHFQKAMEVKPEFIMLSSVVYSSFDADLPIAFSKKGISRLKEELGATPLIITDDLLQRALLDNFSLKEVVRLPIGAGTDILLFSGWKEEIQKAAQDLPEELIDRAVLRIIQLK